MHNKIDEIKNESSPKILRNLFSKEEINKFLNFMKSCQLLYTIKNKWKKKR